MTSSSSSKLTFNHLPTDVQSLTFHHLEPIERALITSTCQEWNQLIMGTRNYWRDFQIGEDCSFERLMEMLQVFTERSQGTLELIIIDRKVDDAKELQRIFELINSSSSCVRHLSIRQGDSITLSTQSRIYARSLPNLYLLSCTQLPFHHTLLKMAYPDPSNQNRGLAYYYTDHLSNVQHDELPWLSHLSSLLLWDTNSIKDVCTIIESNKSNLKSLRWLSVMSSRGQTAPTESIVLEALSTLRFPLYPFSRPALVFNLVTPSLKRVYGRLAQLQAVNSPFLSRIEIALENEGEGTGWNAEQSDYLQEIVLLFSKYASVRKFSASNTTPNSCPVQIAAIVRALSNIEDKTPSLPQLQIFKITSNTPVRGTEDLVEMFLGREQLRRKNGRNQSFTLTLPEEDRARFDVMMEKRIGKLE